MTQTTPCPTCAHGPHPSGARCDGIVHHGPNQHRCACLNQPGRADQPCPPLMTCQGGTLDYADIRRLQIGYSIHGPHGEVISPDALLKTQSTDQTALRDRIAKALARTELKPPYPHCLAMANAVLAELPTPTDTAAEVCVCGHTEQQHFEDVCITEITGCDCGDFLVPSAAREVIARWQKAAMRKTTDRATEDAPLSLFYEHPACGFHWHGRDGMDIPMRDGQPVCPRCELTRADTTQPQAPTDRAAELTAAERTMLTYALDQAQEHIWSRDGFTDEDQAAVTSLRRLAAEARQDKPWLSDASIIGRTLIWTWADIGKGAYGKGYRDAQEQARTLLIGPQEGAEAQQHAPGTAVLCSECRDKGHSICVPAEPTAPRHAGGNGEEDSCGPAPDQCGDEPCANHERAQAHAEGEHAFCGPECSGNGEQQDAPVHACPGPDDNGISPCCGRPPFEFRGERLTRDRAKVTCKGART